MPNIFHARAVCLQLLLNIDVSRPLPAHMSKPSALLQAQARLKCVCVGGENGFPKRPGMVDEFDQQVSTSMDGKHIPLIKLATHA